MVAILLAPGGNNDGTCGRFCGSCIVSCCGIVQLKWLPAVGVQWKQYITIVVGSVAVMMVGCGGGFCGRDIGFLWKS